MYLKRNEEYEDYDSKDIGFDYLILILQII